MPSGRRTASWRRPELRRRPLLLLMLLSPLMLLLLPLLFARVLPRARGLKTMLLRLSVVVVVVVIVVAAVVVAAVVVSSSAPLLLLLLGARRRLRRGERTQGFVLLPVVTVDPSPLGSGQIRCRNGSLGHFSRIGAGPRRVAET